VGRSDRQTDATRGGVGIVSRPGERPRSEPPRRPDQPPAAPDPRRARQGRPVPPPAGDQQAPAGANPRAQARRGDRVPPRGAAPRNPTGGQPAVSPAAPARPRPRSGAPWRVAPARAPKPQPAQSPAQAPYARAGVTAAGSHRMPFMLLLCGLLGGALVSALVISTTLAEGSFQITKLQDSTSALAKQQQVLEEEVAQQESPQGIEQQAAKLGMRRVGELRFIDLTTGKTSNDGTPWIGAANAPGYAP